MAPQTLRSPGKLRPEDVLQTPEKENFSGPWNLDLSRFQQKCAEIRASLSNQPSLGDRVRAETARGLMSCGDAPLPSTTVLQSWSPGSERSPLQDCTVQSPGPQRRAVAGAAAPQTPRWCLEFEDLRRKMQHSISALQRSNAQQAEMQAALSQAGELLSSEKRSGRAMSFPGSAAGRKLQGGGSGSEEVKGAPPAQVVRSGPGATLLQNSLPFPSSLAFGG